MSSSNVGIQEKRNRFALEWAERYGIVDFSVKGCKMIYYKTYPSYLSNPSYTVKHTVNCDTGEEVTERLSKVIKKGFFNV